ncbi:hypothetical protein [Asticcacaulis sp. AND118]|uniref:hypothetical protein n=1 Tax=Asticcacaulis sp. AND118 TaxID=2840468 RepID=UPI001CFF87CC|nr:hypothetical protein [Asticcacaulis sp. AND118]UDF03496.1 hypothetical protein LH365_00200 [Asticcacaulis sp. AND118]
MNKYALPALAGLGLVLFAFLAVRSYSGGEREPKAAASNWKYIKQKDEMDGSYALLASVSSYDDLDTGFNVLTSTKGWDYLTALSTEEGSFLCSSRCDVTLKFDDGPSQIFNAIPNPNGGSNMIVIGNSERILPQLRSARRLVVRATYYRRGEHTSVFDVSGYDETEHRKID